MIFEMITGDFLFEPRKGQNYGKTDDHLAQMMELLGPMPKSFAMAGKQFENFFAFDEFKGKYSYKKISGLQYFPLKSLLIEKYKLKVVEADALAEFLMLILKWQPKERASAEELLSHRWLTMPGDYNFKMTDLEFKKYKLK